MSDIYGKYITISFIKTNFYLKFSINITQQAENEGQNVSSWPHET